MAHKREIKKSLTNRTNEGLVRHFFIAIYSIFLCVGKHMEILKFILVLYFGTLLPSYYIFNKIFVDRETKTYRISEREKKMYFLIIQ